MSAIGEFINSNYDRATGSFAELRAQLLARAGTVTGAAKAAGVDRRTWQRWANGQQPKQGTIDKLRAAVAKPDRATNTLTVTGPVGTRQIKLTPGTAEKVSAAYQLGGIRDAERALLNGVRDAWYREYLSGEAGDDNDSIGVPESVSFS